MLIIDIETNGFLDVLDTIHCIVIYDTDAQEYTRYNDQGGSNTISKAMERIEYADSVLAHNGIGFDYPAIKKVYPGFNPAGKLLDSLVMSRLIWTNIKDMDFLRIAKKKLPKEFKKFAGKHSLESWGYRLGELKGDFGKDTDWQTWSPEMEDYCEQDVRVTFRLWELIKSRNYSQEAMDLEHDFARIIARQERFGFKFDIDKADELHRELLTRKAELTEELQKIFPPWEVIIDPCFVPKVNSKKYGYTKGVPVVKKKMVTFNPGSRDHIANRLKTLYKWKPTEFTPSGKPAVDETILAKLPFSPCKKLNEYLMIEKRLGQLAEGQQAWLKCVTNGRIQGSVNTNGAVTGRCTHSRPNVAQTPSCIAPYGPQCRKLFTVDPGYKLIGADASGLELRCLAHYMALYDKGTYGNIILNSDIHTENQKAAGLPTRDNAKTFIYGFLYGAGDAKIGEIVAPLESENKRRNIGRKLRRQFLANLPALEKLTRKVKEKAKKRRQLKGLDGRILHVRSEHSALNTLLQSAGALIMKKALVILDGLLKDAGFENSAYSSKPQYEFVANIHDEFQIQVDNSFSNIEKVQELSVKAMRLAGEHFNFRIPISGEAKAGDSWKETH